MSQALLALPFDHIFFTGSPAVGRLVMKAAAEHLTSVTLELGGKSPAIVERSADVTQAAGRIIWGKAINTGQACIAPDYVLVDEAVHDEFVAAAKKAVEAIPPEDRTAIVNERHTERVQKLIDSATAAGGTVVTDSGPTVITSPALESKAMSEEIFGPLLPVIPYRSIDQAMDLMAARAKPLVLYVFSRNRDAVRRISRAAAGATVINHTMIHFYQLNLPFGGAGESGMGRGHGRFGFEAFSNVRGELEQRMPLSPIQWLVPPYSWAKNKIIDLVVKYF